MKAPRPISWFSVARSPYRTFIVGVGLGRSRENRSFCIIIQLGLWFVGVGPHYTPSRSVVTLPRRAAA